VPIGSSHDEYYSLTPLGAQTWSQNQMLQIRLGRVARVLTNAAVPAARESIPDSLVTLLAGPLPSLRSALRVGSGGGGVAAG